MHAREVNLVATLGTTIGQAVDESVAAACGMAGAAAAGLAVLLATPGVGMDAFARTVGVSGSGGVRLADRLTAAGLVQRRSGGSAREVSLWLTPAGEAAAGEVLRARRSAVQRLITVLDAAERAALVQLAEKVLAAATVDRAQAEWLCRLCDVEACPSRHCPVEQAVA